jgi:enoyl-CoA hydratase/carnithine racemase
VSSLLVVEAPARHVRRVTLNRPEQLNAMTAELSEALHAELRAIATDRSCRAVILTGARARILRRRGSARLRVSSRQRDQ